MTQQMYSIREAAKLLGVEAHALRFWEEELDLRIERNTQGRRVYCEEDMEQFRRILSWKEEGLQLKDIRQMLQTAQGEPVQETEQKTGNSHIIMYHPKELVKQEPAENEELERTEKAKRLQQLLKQFISESIRENNEEILQVLKEGLLKELDYQFRLQEEREAQREQERIEKEDEHFKLLDENLRSAVEKGGRKKKKLFGR